MKLEFKALLRRFLARSIHKHRIFFGPLRGYMIVTSWHDYPALTFSIDHLLSYS